MIEKKEYRKSIICFILSEDNKLLLCHKPSRGLDDWGLPGGGYKTAENSEQAIERELNEELGLTADMYEVLYVKFEKHKYTWGQEMIDKTGYIGQTQDMAVVRARESFMITLPIYEELDGVIWIELSEVDRFVNKEDLASFIKEEMANVA